MSKQLFTNFLALLLLLATTSFNLNDKHIRIWLVGDSTVCDQPRDRSPVTGWGTPFADFFDSTVLIANRARGGRSTRTFIAEGRWKDVSDSMQAGDYVFMQFGHNDEAKEPQYKDRYTPVPDYKTNLVRFITEARQKKAIPVLVTPVTRMMFDSLGNIKETHKEYSAAVWELGKAYQVPVIDLDDMSRKLLQRYGPERSKDLFMYLDTLQNPHYPNGRADGTHFNEMGARRMAELVLSEIRKQKLELADRITLKAAP
ncbi:MAG: rhamnogalacturonan acetylesterase [Sphingobacteriales bacterium]|nr:MAG: rhamnogalacturonan acetylesterase [Sphingobacteriales bacterium]